jgi:uncharacterized protein (DUF2461 family)
VPRKHGGGAWYVQVRKEGLFVGGGLYGPARQQLAAARSAIVGDAGEELAEVVRGMDAEGVELMSDGSLKSAPRGYPADHPRIELLRLVHYAAGTFHEVGPWIHTAEAEDRVIEGWHAVATLLAWLSANAGQAPASDPRRHR